MKHFFTILIYISLLFLSVALVKAHYLSVPAIYSVPELTVSVLLLFTGFAIDAITWYKVLTRKFHAVSFKNAFTAIGLSIFGKYIPGKIWTVLGRSAYISLHYNYSSKEIVYLSLITQMLSLWIGLLFGSAGLLLNSIFSPMSWIAFGIFILLTLVLFIKKTHALLLKPAAMILNKKVTIPLLTTNNMCQLLPYFIVKWVVFSLAFHVFARSLTPDTIPVFIGLGFPLAGSLGLVAFFFPGGIGVREGILTGYLVSCGMTVPAATTISITARLWYLAGEIFIFLAAVVLQWSRKK